MNRTVYLCFLGCCGVIALFLAGVFQTTPAIYSDLAPMGIYYGSPAYKEIVQITERQVLIFVRPLGMLLACSLLGWGVCVWNLERLKEEQELTPGSAQRASGDRESTEKEN